MSTIEEVIQKTVETTIENNINPIIADKLEKFQSQFFITFANIMNLQTYTVNEAAKKTGIGYKKIRNAIATGKLQCIADGGVTRVRHTDLFLWIEQIKQKQ